MFKHLLKSFKRRFSKSSSISEESITLNGSATNSFKEINNLSGSQSIESYSSKTNCLNCSIKVKDLGKNRKQPIFLNPQTGKLISTQGGRIHLNDGETMELFCPDRFKAPYGLRQIIILRCTNGKLTIDENETNLACFSCSEKVESSLQSTSTYCGHSNAFIFRNGFETHLGFIEIMTHCHDPSTKVTHWVDYQLRPENQFCQSTTKNRFFPSNYIEGQNIKTLYKEQRQTIAKILQSKKLADKIISPKNNIVLDEGHLRPRSDFLLNSLQQATYNRINVMPQFKSFNGGNWNITERALREYIAKKGINARIRSGVHGVLEFKDARGNLKPISLSLDGQLPVPKIFYKIVIPEGKDPLIVFVGVNNPHASLEDIDEHYTFCRNKISRKQLRDVYDFRMKWSDDIRHGYMYACSFEDFNQFVPQMYI